jgi:tetratricopeptide (TPR) repeat protein
LIPTTATRRTTLICLVLGAVTLAVYWPVIHHGFINYDDPKYVVENSRVASGLSWANVAWAFQTGHASNWHPVTWLSHMLDVRLYGLDPAGHHLTSLLLHLANTLLLFAVLQRVTRARCRSAFVAALFALHPLHVESVAWIAERKDVLSTFFFMLTLWAYARYAEVQSPKSKVQSQNPGVGSQELDSDFTHHASRFTFHVSRYYILSLLFFACGLMSKPMLVTVPFLLLLLDYWPLQRFQLSALSPGPSINASLHHSTTPITRLVLEKLPFLAFSLTSCIVTLLMQGKGEALATTGGFPIEDRVANGLVSYLRYVGKTLWPADLAVFYPLPAMQHPGDDQWPAWLVLGAGFFLAAVTMLVLRASRRQPWLAMGWLWFLGTLVPVIGLVQAGSQAMADRYTYIPLIGLFVAMVWSAAELLRARGAWHEKASSPGEAEHPTSNNRYPTSIECQSGWRWWLARIFPVSCARQEASASGICLYGARLALVSSGVLILADCAAVTRKQLNYWRDDFALFGHTLAVTTENNVPAHYCLGLAFGKQGKYDLAIPQFRAVLPLAPGLADAHYHLGLCLMSSERLPEAVAEYQAALQLNPGHPLARNNLAVTLLALDKLDEAAAQFVELARLEPDSPVPLCSLGGIRLRQRKAADAEAHFAEAVRRQPDFIPALTGLGRALFAQGKFTEAQTQFREVVRRCPASAEAHANLGLSYARRSQLDEAVREFQEQLRLQPDGQAWYNLALARVMQGNLEEAAANYEQAVKLENDWPVALNDLAWIRATAPQAELRNGGEAIRLAERACKLSGGKEAQFLGTLDAAYAEAGRFDEAIRTAAKARQLALEAGNKEVASAAEKRLALYRKGQPYRQ